VRKVLPPQYLPLNVIDRQFLVPETDDFANGAYLPMTIVSVVHPRTIPSVSSLQDALIQLDNLFPQYRLSYALDPLTPRWVRVPEKDRIPYLRNRVQQAKADTVDEHLSASVRNNLSPVEDPLKIFFCKDSLCIHLYHPSGDAKFLFQLTASLLTALFKPEQLEQGENRFSVPLSEVVMRDIPQTIKVLGHTLKRVSEKATNYVSGLPSSSIVIDSKQKSVFQATVSGTKMRVMHVEIPPDKMMRIRSVVQSLPKDQKISLNTYWQIFFAFRLNEMGLVDWPIELTTLVDLRRYMKNHRILYPGNCISNIRLTINKASFADACVDYQNQLTAQMSSVYPLSDIVGNWFLTLAGDKTFRLANRNWYLNASPKEERFFTLTNVGRLDEIFETVSDFIYPDIRLVTPIMGAAPLVIAFTSFNNYGHFTATYKPDILSTDNICQIMDF